MPAPLYSVADVSELSWDRREERRDDYSTVRRLNSVERRANEDRRRLNLVS